MRAALFSWTAGAPVLGQLELLAGRRGDHVVARLEGSEHLKTLGRMATERRMDAVLVGELAELGNGLVETLRLLHRLTKYGCYVVPLDNVGIDAPRQHVETVLAAILHMRERLTTLRTVRLPDMSASWQQPFGLDDIPKIGFGKGERIAEMLREPERQSVRYIADICDVAPNTVMKVKKLLHIEG